MKPITIFTGATGLNMIYDPVRLPRQKDGRSDLQVAVNVSIDQSYRVNSRKGAIKIQDGSFHSLFCDGADCFVIQGDALFQVAEDGSLRGIRDGLNESAKMSFCQVGPRTYYSNGFEFGFIEGGISYAWEKGTYRGPDTNRVFNGPFPGEHLSELAGRMFISDGKVLWWSELFDFGLYDQAKGFIQFYSNIRMIKSVDTGLFISTDYNIYFMAGVNPSEWKPRKLTNYPAIEWTDSIQYVDAADIGINAVGLCPVWASAEGVNLATPEGVIYNLTKSKIIYPETAMSGFGEMVGTNFIHGVK